MKTDKLPEIITLAADIDRLTGGTHNIAVKINATSARQLWAKGHLAYQRARCEIRRRQLDKAEGSLEEFMAATRDLCDLAKLCKDHPETWIITLKTVELLKTFIAFK